jgi:hypothetical protein
MADPNIPSDPVADAMEKLIGKIDKLAASVEKNTTSNDEEREENKKNANVGGKRATQVKNSTKALINNTTGLLGLTASMLTVQGMLGDMKGMNARLSKDLGQLGMATKENFNATMTRFESVTGKQSMGMAQALETFSDAVGLGMAGFSDDLMRLGGNFKVLGLSNKSMMSTVRGMTQALGNSEESQIEFMNTLVATAAANRTSADGMIAAIESMKDALTKTTVELGPNATARAAEVAAMMGQGNEELKAMSAKFVTSFLAGSEGFEKAARLGVQFTGEETTAEMAAKFETLLGRIQDLGGDAQGAGSQFFFDAMEKQLGLSREDFMLQQRLGTDIQALVKGNVEDQARQVGQISIDQAYQNATFGFQKGALNMTTQIAQMMEKYGEWIPKIAILASIFGAITSLPVKLLRGLAAPFRFIGGAFKDMGRLIGNVFKGRGFDRRMAGGGRFKSGGKMVGSQAGKAATKLGSRIPVAGALLAGGMEYAESGDISRSAAAGAGALGGAIGGAKAGMMIGAFLGPLGAAAGTLIGGAVGAFAGTKLAKTVHDSVDTEFVADQAAKAAKEANKVRGATPKTGEGEKSLAKVMGPMTLEDYQKEMQAKEDEAAKQRTQLNDMTKESLEITKSKMTPATDPFSKLSGALVNNLAAINNLVGLTEQANQQREEGNEVLNTGATGVATPIGVQATG